MKLKPLQIGNLVARIPIIQGGMGIGISLSGLAGVVAKEGGVGVISAAQPGFNEPDFRNMQKPTCALGREIRKAKEISNNGVIGVNIMCALRHYKEYVRCCIENGADLIISGAGLPTLLPELVQGSKIKFAPIVSSLKGHPSSVQTMDPALSYRVRFCRNRGADGGRSSGLLSRRSSRR